MCYISVGDVSFSHLLMFHQNEKFHLSFSSKKKNSQPFSFRRDFMSMILNMIQIGEITKEDLISVVQELMC